MQKKVIYKDGKLVEIRKVYILFDEEGNVIRKCDYHIPFSISKKEEKIILHFNELEDAPI